MDSKKAYLRIDMEGDKYESTVCADFVGATKMWLALGIDIARSFDLPPKVMVQMATLVPSMELTFERQECTDMTALLNMGGDHE